MANICDMTVHIVCATDEDGKALICKMAENFKAVSDIDVLKNVTDAGRGWLDYAAALDHELDDGWNNLSVFDPEPDTGSEGGWTWFGEAYGKPYVRINMQLKWAPSTQPNEFCGALDPERYGFAIIDGGEYMCAMGDEIAFIQHGKCFGRRAFSGSLEYSEFMKLQQSVAESEPMTLSEMALAQLFSYADASTYYWDAAEEDDCCDEGDGRYDAECEGCDIPCDWSRLKRESPELIQEALELIEEYKDDFGVCEYIGAISDHESLDLDIDDERAENFIERVCAVLGVDRENHIF